MATQQPLLSNATITTTTSFKSLFPHPSGVIHNTATNWILLLYTILPAIATVIVLLHLTSSIRHGGRLSRTDSTLTLAFFSLLALVLIQFQALQYGLGSPISHLTPDDLSALFQKIWLWRLIHSSAKTVAQVAVLTMLAESWTLRNRFFRWGWLTALSLTLVTGLLAVYINMTQCSPIASFWDITAWRQSGMKCQSSELVVLLSTVPFGVSSVLTLALPVGYIFFAKVSLMRKTGMWMLWTVGFFVTWVIGAYTTLMIGGYTSTQSLGGDAFVVCGVLSVSEVAAGVFIAGLPKAVEAFKKVEVKREVACNEDQDVKEDVEDGVN